MMGWADFEVWRERRRELLREAQERQLEREARRVREAFGSLREGEGEIEVRWGLSEDEARISALLDLNGMPRWLAFEERFIVAEKDGRVLAALRYSTESKRVSLGLMVVEPWAGECRMARALYEGAKRLAGEAGVREVLAQPSPSTSTEYLREAGYGRRGRVWRTLVTPTE